MAATDQKKAGSGDWIGGGGHCQGSFEERGEGCKLSMMTMTTGNFIILSVSQITSLYILCEFSVRLDFQQFSVEVKLLIQFYQFRCTIYLHCPQIQ